MNPGPRGLLDIPGVGPAVRADLEALGITRVAELRGRDPEVLYLELCDVQGRRIDRCMLYVLRCAVYYASTPDPEPGRLKWWAWKDSAQTGGGS